jgi:hypothetical protein
VFPKRAVRIGASIIIWAFAILGGFSIGLFYIPSAAAELAFGAGTSYKVLSEQQPEWGLEPTR